MEKKHYTKREYVDSITREKEREERERHALHNSRVITSVDTWDAAR